MKFCLYLPVGNITAGEFQSQQAIKQMTWALEQAKIDACCVTDHPAPSSEWLAGGSGHDALDPFTALAFVAAASNQLQLMTNILVLPYRNPFITAKAATTLQLLSDNRFIMGVGAGYQKPEFEALGVDFHQRGKLTDEALDTIKTIWKGGKIVARGMHFNAQNNEPRPSPTPPPKIWVGGSSDRAIARAAKYGDGWCPFFAISHHSEINKNTGIQSVTHLGVKIAELKALRQQHHQAGDFDINIAISSTDNFSERSAQEAERFLDDLSQLEAVGVNWVTVKLRHPDRTTYLENVHWFGEEVVAQYRK